MNKFFLLHPPIPRYVCVSPHYHCSWNTWRRSVTKLLFRSSLVHLLGGDLDVFQRFDSAFTLQALGSPGESEEPQIGATKKSILSSGNFCFMLKLRYCMPTWGKLDFWMSQQSCGIIKVVELEDITKYLVVFTIFLPAQASSCQQTF